MSFFASGVTNHNRPRQALARYPDSCVGDAGRATSYYSLRADRMSDFGGKPENIYSFYLTACEPEADDRGGSNQDPALVEQQNLSMEITLILE